MSAPDAFNAWLRRGLMIGVHAFWMMVVGVALIPAPRPADALSCSKPYIKDGTVSICIDLEVGKRVYQVCFAPPHPTSEPSEAVGQ